MLSQHTSIFIVFQHTSIFIFIVFQDVYFNLHSCGGQGISDFELDSTIHPVALYTVSQEEIILSHP